MRISKLPVYGGMVITGVLDQVPERLAHVVYLDAEVPRDSESEFDFAGPEFREQKVGAAKPRLVNLSRPGSFEMESPNDCAS